MFKTIKKRNGHIAPFKIEKITNAIFKASVAVGEPNWQIAETLAKEVVLKLKKAVKRGAVPSIEEIQNMVEQVLIDTAHARIAKAYILYRQERAEIRNQKKQVLNKEEIDEVDKKFDVNALRILASRYLNKNEERKVVESPKKLFERVATHTALTSLFFDQKVFQKNGQASEHRFEEFEPEKFENKFSIGEYKLNKYHLEAIKRVYERFSRKREIKVSWPKFLELLGKGYFDKYENEIKGYYDLMINRLFLPNTPTLANFGGPLGMGSACFALGIEDSIDSIMDTLKSAAIIFKSGGGLGYNFSNLRPEGDYIKTTNGASSGPISFMSMFDNMTEVIKQGGMRRGANMGILNSNHPDIEKFIHAKEGNKALKNFNISVMVMPELWEAYKKNEPYALINPRNGKAVAKVDPKKFIGELVYQAWESAEPGILFFDRINEFNPLLKSLGPLYTTNPCSELTLYPNESCNLGSINVSAFVKKNHNNVKKPQFDWKLFEEVIKKSTRFLDNIIDITKHPLPEIEEMTLNTRKIGLGIMGLGDLLYELGISYNDKEGLKFMEQLMEFVAYHSKVVSIELSKERGRAPYFEKSFYKEGRLPFSASKDKKSWHFDWAELAKKIQRYGIRNLYTTTIAPTGSLSMLAGTSSGIEPVYSLVFEKSIAIGNFFYIDPVFNEAMQTEGLMDEALIKEVAEAGGTIHNVPYIPQKLKKVFVVAHDIAPEQHVKVLASFQRWVDASISKTNNFPSNATVEDVRKAYFLAYELGCKGITVYRDKSLQTQVLIGGSRKGAGEKQKDGVKLSVIKDEKAKGFAVYHEVAGANVFTPTAEDCPEKTGEIKMCPNCNINLVFQEGCRKCPACGWGMCS